MKKLSGLLTVSLVAFMMAPAARADIASTAYVDNKDTAIRNDMELKTNKATKNYTSGSTTEYPSIKVAEDIAKIAAGAAVGNYALKEELEEEADARGQADTEINKKITTINNSDVMKSGATKTKIDTIATNTTAAANAKSAADAAQKTADGLKTSKQDKLVASGENANIAGSDGVSVSIGTDGKITVKGNQAAIDTALAGKQDKLGTDQLNAVNSGITKAKVTTYDGYADKITAAQNTADGLKTSKQDKLTAGTGIKIDTATNTISTDGLATNSDLTALQKTVSGHTTSINKLDGADSVDGSVKQQIKMAKSELTTSIQANTTAANEAKKAADAAQATANKAVVANDAITAGTGTKIMYDAKGLVTGSTSLAASDIPTLTTGKISGLDTALAAKFVAPGTSVTSTDGTYTLTMKVADGKPTYAWEKIGR